MITLILILVAVFLLGLGCGATIWSIFRHRQTAKSKEPAKETTVEALTFRWSYIILPVAILLLSIILSAYFYHLLPTEVAYHFKLDGTPDKWLSREMTMVWVLTPQFLLTLLAGAIVWGMTKLGTLFRQTGNTWIRPERIISFMGNIIALPQLIVCFAMLNIFSYNSYQRHIMPMWIFVLIIMGLGAITLGIFFILVIRRAWEATQ